MPAQADKLGRSRIGRIIPDGCPAPFRRFTLIELLVVITIIAILAALLMPALRRSRMMARQVMCLSQKRHVGVSFFLYMGDYGRTMARTDTRPSTVLRWRHFYYEYLHNLEVTVCPEYTFRRSEPEDVNAQRGYDGMYNLVNPTQHGFAESVASVRTHYADGVWAGVIVERLANPSNMMAVACTSNEAGHRRFNRAGGSAFRAHGGVTYGGAAQTYLWLAHMGGVASLFFDGSARRLELEEVAYEVDNADNGTRSGIRYFLDSDQQIISLP